MAEPKQPTEHDLVLAHKVLSDMAQWWGHLYLLAEDAGDKEKARKAMKKAKAWLKLSVEIERLSKEP